MNKYKDDEYPRSYLMEQSRGLIGTFNNQSIQVTIRSEPIHKLNELINTGRTRLSNKREYNEALKNHEQNKGSC